MYNADYNELFSPIIALKIQFLYKKIEFSQT
jgi:hypothetical protein